VSAACIRPQQRTAVIQSPILKPGSVEGAALLFVSDGHRHWPFRSYRLAGWLNCLCRVTLYNLIRILVLDGTTEV